MSPHHHKIFKLALPGDAVCSAGGFMLCLMCHRPLPNLTVSLRSRDVTLMDPTVSLSP